MALVIDFSVSQSSDGKKLIFTDNGNWPASGLNIVDYTRTIELWDNKDATGTKTDTLTFTGNTLTIEHPVTVDKYYSAKYAAVNGATNVVKTINFGTVNFEYKLLTESMKNGCGCDSGQKEEDRRNGFIFLILAQNSALPFGNVGRFNKFITDSNACLTR
jgi:hypothetical protein